MNKLRGRDFLGIIDYNKEDLENILNLAFELKRKVATGEPHPILAGKNLGMLFSFSSTRTRISFETGMSQLGGHAQYYSRESISYDDWLDAGRVMSRFLDGIVIRYIGMPPLPVLPYGGSHKILETLAEGSRVPVINAMDDVEHPCQSMADMMTIIEKFGVNYRDRKVVLHWVPNRGRFPEPSMAHSLLLAGTTLGMGFTIMHPPGFNLDPVYMEEVKRRAQANGKVVEEVTVDKVGDRMDVVKGADVIYASSFGPVPNQGEPILSQEKRDKLSKPFNNWTVIKEEFDVAAKGAIFMHYMPLDRGLEVTDEVLEGPMCAIYDEAENRLHAGKGIMSLLMS